LKAVAYLRISREDESLENQRFAIDKWALDNDIDIVMYFPDPEISGAVDPFERPAFKSMIKYARKNGISAIVFEDISRLARNFELGKKAYLRLLREGFKIFFVRDPRLNIDIDGLITKIDESLSTINDPAVKPFAKALKSLITNIIATIGEFYLDVGFAMAEAYLEEVRERTKRALARLKQEGRLYHKPSLVHYYAAWLYNKEIGQVTREEYETAKKQLASIIKKYWKNPAIKKTRIPEILAKNELAEMYQRFPKAPKDYLTFYRLIRNSNPEAQ